MRLPRAPRSRRADRLGLLLGAAAIGGVAVAGAFIGDTERIGAYWTHAHVDTDDRAEVIEVIDYDFGSNRRRGILRQIPDVDTTAPFSVDSPTAPDDLLTQSWWSGTELRIGDPDQTISNRHRYTIAYPHDGLVFGQRVIWNAVGDGWSVDVHDIEIHLTSDRALSDPTCDAGRAGTLGGCTAELIGPGHVVARVDESAPGRFVTVGATLGTDLVAPEPPIPPTGPAPDPGSGWQSPGLIAAAAALAGAIAAAAVNRRAGRERVWVGGPADVAYGPTGADDVATRLIDHADLAEMATIEFEAPRDLSAALGGVVHRETVTKDHQTAWLLEAAIRDEIHLDLAGTTPTIRRGPATPNPAVGAVLDRMFGGATTILLSSYDADFAAGWEHLAAQLEAWRHESGLWEERGRRRRTTTLVLGGMILLAGGLLTALFAGFANTSGTSWLPAVAGAGLAAGVGVGALLTAWELRVRSAAGSGAWLRVESFRRFLHDSEARHVERAAEMGLLRQYTAWAVALGEVDHWRDVVNEAAAQPGSVVGAAPGDVVFASSLAPAMSRSVTTASTAPSSSGGGGGGGGAGGGGGGGGGGSW